MTTITIPRETWGAMLGALDLIVKKTNSAIIDLPEADAERASAALTAANAVSEQQAQKVTAKTVMCIPVAYGQIDANTLEQVAKEYPNEYFLKGSGVLKLITSIRQLEQKTKLLQAQGEAAPPCWYIQYQGYGQVTLRGDEAASALDNGAIRVTAYIAHPQATDLRGDVDAIRV